MNKLIVTLFLSSLLISCDNDEFSRICNYEIKTLREPLVSKSLIGEEVMLSDSVITSYDHIIVYDSLLFAYQMRVADGYFYHIYNLNNGENLGRFIPKGRAKNEALGIPNVQQIQLKDGQLIFYVYDYLSKKMKLWNISKSIDQNRTVFDSMLTLPDSEDSYSHIFYLDNGDFAAHSVLSYIQNAFNPAPDYFFGDSATNEITDSLNLYNGIIEFGEHPGMYLQTNDNISPDLSKIAIAMQCQPHIAIVDVEKRSVKGFNIENGATFDPNNPTICFDRIDVDDNYIYALFLGLDSRASYEEAKSVTQSTLYKFNWDGELVKKYIFKDRVIFKFAIDRSSKSPAVYGVNIDFDKIYRYNLDE